MSSEKMNSERSKPENSEVRSGGDGPSGGIEQRQHPRYDFFVPVFVRVLIGEETFNPLRFPGHSLNISAGGMMVEIESLPEAAYRKMIRQQRPVRVHMHLPEDKGETVFFGKIVWYDFRQTSAGTSCLLGMQFDALHAKEQEALGKLLEQLAARSSSASGTASRS
jgi:hypothetical protein